MRNSQQSKTTRNTETGVLQMLKCTSEFYMAGALGCCRAPGVANGGSVHLLLKEAVDGGD